MCRAGAVSAFLAVGFGVLQIIIEIIGVGFLRIPVPTDMPGWFDLLQTHQLLGLTELTAFQIPALALCAPLFLALHGILGRRTRTPAFIATPLALIGIAVYLSSNTAFSLLHLSNDYAAATNELQKSMLLAAGESMLAIYEGIGVDVGLFLFMIAVFIVSALAFREPALGKAIASVGLLAALLTFSYYVCSAFTSLAIFVLEAAGAFLVLWFFLVGRRLLRIDSSS